MSTLNTDMLVNASATGAPNTTSAEHAKGELREAAQKLVGEVFYGTLLRQLRDSALKGEYGHGGRGEEVFRGQLDQVLASRAGTSGDNELTDALVKRFERRAEAVAAYRDQMRARMEETAREAAAMTTPAVGEIAA